ncbi:MAG TPA: hydroxymyristoyl-ACP dehydratase [Rhodanobacteraceae bacterium]|jgi:3-hydroxymyristoyl/3-hydroxydecanoyl-(acyl carrier protein) dehydratase|nr:hydroxymyristoyl-ACP dehydratase [Rhodanobacteraceae bacterium]
MTESFRTELLVDASHPSLSGHFPGNPVVPGVVLLERVAAAMKAWRGAAVGALDAKFLNPLRPGEAAAIELRDGDGRVRFSVTHADGAVLARGTLEVLA